MTGNNEMILNHATMLTAVEHWLNTTQMKAPVNVTDVSYNSGTRQFNVEFEPQSSASGGEK